MPQWKAGSGSILRILSQARISGITKENSFWPGQHRKTSSAGGHVSDERTGRDGFQRKITIKRDEKLPGCGVVSHMTGDENGDVTLDIETLYKFMIVVSEYDSHQNALYKAFTETMQSYRL